MRLLLLMLTAMPAFAADTAFTLQMSETGVDGEKTYLLSDDISDIPLKAKIAEFYECKVGLPSNEIVNVRRTLACYRKTDAATTVDMSASVSTACSRLEEDSQGSRLRVDFNTYDEDVGHTYEFTLSCSSQ